MEIAYWIVASLLAVFYLYSGGIKLARSQEKLAPMMAWAGTVVPMGGVRAIGAAEVLGAIGLVVPAALGIDTLSLVAASCLLVLQLLATGFHLSRGERSQIGLNLALILLSAVCVWLATSL